MPSPSVAHSGIWHMSKTRPQAQRAADGTFTVVLLVMDRQGPHQVEPWRVTYSGPQAQAWWDAEGNTLQPGDTLRLTLTHMRIHTVADRHAVRSEAQARVQELALVARAIENSTEPGEIVLDLFGGSGSTLMAADQLGRPCRMMEMEPAWCDAIVSRWEQATGMVAVRHPPKGKS